MLKDKRNEVEKQEKSKVLEEKLVQMLWPVLVELKRKVDRRLVKTFLGLVLAIVIHRHRNHGFGKRVWWRAICGNAQRSAWKNCGHKANGP